MASQEKIYEVIRFGIVGVIATAIQYGIYWLLVDKMNETVANTIGYVISFCCNFLMTTFFTFKVKPNKQKAGGFAFSHLINLGLQSLLLNLFLWLGISKEWAPLPMFAVCVPVNFLLVRYFVKLKG